MIKIGIPSKGRLRDATIQWFAQRSIKIMPSGSEREYRAEISGLDDVEVVLMSAGEIPVALAEARLEIGVTGQDMIYEKVHNPNAKITQISEMGFGHADLVLAVPTSWIDVTDLEDLDAVCADFRTRIGHRLRVATKYHRLVGDYLRENDVTNFQLIDSQGATEGVVANEYAEMIADITSTGDTLRANHLKILGDPILRSQACVFSVNEARISGAKKAAFAQAIAKLSQA